MTTTEKIPQLLVATGNPGKLKEFRELLAGHVGRVLSSADVSAPEIEEDRPTLEGNALKKAETLFRLTGIPALADDTGLEVEALDGRPGVYSARYAGPEADPKRNIAKLLEELQAAPNRHARFRTAIVYLDEAGPRTYEGVCRGTILEAPRGRGGFGYDPIFLPDEAGLTFAELPAEEKNSISHRGRAMKAFLEDIARW